MQQSRKVVGHVLPWGAIGGTELATLRIAQAVRDKGFDSVMFCRADAPAVRQFFAEKGFATASYDEQVLLPGRWAAFAQGSLELAREFRRHKIDIVHCADVAAGDHAALAAKLAGKVLVCHVRNRYDWLTRFQRLWLLLVNKIVFVSSHTQQNFGRTARKLGDVAKRAGVVVYDGFTPEESSQQAAMSTVRQQVLHELGVPPNAKIVGMVARLALQKDHLTLVEAAERVIEAHPDVRFLLVGGCGPEQHELLHGDRVLKRIAAGSARDHIVYTGFRSDVGRLLSALDIFVLCTHFEGLPLVLLEAMAHGKPVVATAVDGIPEVVVDGKTGLLHRHEDAEHLASQLLSLLASESRSRDLGRAGREFVQERFSTSRFADDMRHLYEGLLHLERDTGMELKRRAGAS